MSQPAYYKGTAILSGQVSDYVSALDPRNWGKNAPAIWSGSYLIDVSGVAAAPAGVVGSPLPSSRLDDPPPDKSAVTAWNYPGLFYEEVLFAGITYRNVLATSYADHSKGPGVPSIAFNYWEYGCLNAQVEGNDPVDGGVGVDNGIVSCVQDDATHVRVTISKSVRFDEPDDLEEDLNTLAQVLVPLTLDVWLHSLIFESTGE